MKVNPKIRINLDMTPVIDSLAEAMTASDILGRVRVLMEAAKQMPVNPMGHLSEKTFAELLGIEPVKSQEAINFLKNLTPFTKRAYNRLYPQYRLAAFTVAKVEDLFLVERTQDLLVEAMEKGWTREQFIANLNLEFDAAGVTRLNPYHLDTVYQTNMQTAFMNGRYQQLRDPDVMAALPWWRYRTMEDADVRPNHAALNGFIAKADDPVWGSIYPPNGYNCRCEVEPLLDGEARGELGAQAKVPGRDRLPADGGPDEGFGRKPGRFLQQLESGRTF